MAILKLDARRRGFRWAAPACWLGMFTLLLLVASLPAAAQNVAQDWAATAAHLNETFAGRVSILRLDSVPDGVHLKLPKREDWRRHSNVPYSLGIISFNGIKHGLEWRARPLARFREPSGPPQIIRGPEKHYRLEWAVEPQDWAEVEKTIAAILLPESSTLVDWSGFWPPSGKDNPVSRVQKLRCKYCPKYAGQIFREAGISGTVSIRYTVTETGHVAGVELLEKAGHGVDQKIIYFVSRWRYHPPLADGIPVRTSVQSVTVVDLGTG